MVNSSPWINYSHPVVSDLAWLLLSPKLFDNALDEFASFNQSSDMNATCDWLNHLDRKSQETPHLLAQIERTKFRRLGIYFEALFAFWVKQGKQDKVHSFDMVIKNHQINDGKTTIGELDFLLMNHEEVYTHVETAVKFYLLNTNVNDTIEKNKNWSSWIGPNARDRLDIKLQKLIEHQLPLLNNVDVKKDATLNKTINKKIRSKHFLCGRFYLPIDSLQQLAELPLRNDLPHNANSKALTGVWLSKSQWLRSSLSSYHWIPLKKTEWMTGVSMSERKTRQVSYLDICKSLTHSPPNPHKMLPLHLAYTKENSEPQYLMIVEDHWPEIKEPLRKM